jgi:hypothetical protein
MPIVAAADGSRGVEVDSLRDCGFDPTHESWCVIPPSHLLGHLLELRLPSIRLQVHACQEQLQGALLEL